MTTALIERIFLKFHPSDEESGVEKSEPSQQGYLEKARDPHDSMSGVPKASAGNLYDFIVEATEILERFDVKIL